MTIQEIRQQFYAYRNGMVADALRKGGVPHKVIFGLNMPQLSAIAQAVKAAHTPEECAAIGAELWQTGDSREARLLACWLMDTDISIDAAEALARSTRSREEDDLLGFRFFKRYAHASAVADRLVATAADSIVASVADVYRAEAIRRHLL